MSAESAAHADDLAAIRGGAALVERATDLVEISGPDRLRLLQGLVTADVKGLAAGTTVGGFFASGQGRILADFRLLAFAESCWLLLPPGRGEAIRAHLEKYKVASQVEISTIADRRLFELRGSRASAAAEMARALSGEGGQAAVASDAGSTARFLLLLQASEVEDFLTKWMRKASSLRLRRVSAAASEIARIEDGELQFGVDFNEENFPQESGRESAVSYAKGCYLGQEVVARIHYRGGVQRLPRGLRFESAASPVAGEELLLAGRTVGRATSVASSPRFGAIGLGLVHQRAAAPGTRLEIARGGTAEVVELPFVDEAAAG